jgi:cyanophycinase
VLSSIIWFETGLRRADKIRGLGCSAFAVSLGYKFYPSKTMTQLRKLRTFIILTVLLLTSCNNPLTYIAKDPIVGPASGTLIAGGGGGGAIFRRFVDLAGGSAAKIVFIPTAFSEESRQLQDLDGFEHRLRNGMGLPNLTVLHTRDPTIANSAQFVRLIQAADCVWFDGGRQWRLADAYLNTKTHMELKKLLDRGGVIGGNSAGATIQGSFLVRGDTASNRIMMGDHQVGLGFLRNVAIDQHIFERGRELDLIEVVKEHPEILGIGLDGQTGIIVRGDTMEVVGARYVYIYDSTRWKSDTPDREKFFQLKAGDRYDLGKRQLLR